MGDGHRLAQMMRNAGRTPQNEIVDLIEGEVTSVSPLKVKVENRELTESFLILSALVTETHIYEKNVVNFIHHHVVPSVETDQAGPGPHSHTVPQRNTNTDYSGLTLDIMLWRGLKVGDIVYMLKLARGQKYFILQRKDGVKPT